MSTPTPPPAMSACTFSVRRILSISVLLLFFATGTTVFCQTELDTIPCDASSTDCSPWANPGVSTSIELPDYPGCFIEVFYEKRTCNGVDEYRVYKLLWQRELPVDPCRALTDALNNAPDYGIFERNLFDQALQEMIQNKFDFEYAQSVYAYEIAIANHLADRDNQALLQLYLDAKSDKEGRECPNGQITKRGVLSACQTTFTDKYTVHVPGSLGMPDYDLTYTSVRYVPCAPNPVCCIREYKICHNTVTGETEIEMTVPDPPAQNSCPTVVPNWWPSHNPSNQFDLNPTTIISECLPYCLEGQNEPTGNIHTSPKLGAR